jgi:hypothetical protein
MAHVMKLAVAIASIAGVVLAAAPAGSTSNADVANVAKASSITFKRDDAAISQALERLNLSSLSSVNAVVEAGYAMESDMRVHARLLARTAPSTKAGEAGRSLLSRGLKALAASGDYMLRYGRALGSSAPLAVLQVDSHGYRVNVRKGKTLARRGAALLGVSFG